MTSRFINWTLLLFATIASCGNYSNEDLEFMNAVPARQDFVASIKGAVMLANEAELAKDTHNVILVFNKALDFLKIADAIRSFPPTSRIPDGRVWGPVPDDNHAGWQWRFTMHRAPDVADKFTYTFEENEIGTDTWSTLLSGSFTSTGGERRGTGDFSLKTDPARLAGFTFAPGDDGSLVQELDINYSTAEYPIFVDMKLSVYPDYTNPDPATISTINYHYEALADGQGGMHFDGTDSTGKMLAIDSRWQATGRGRADATANPDPVTGAVPTWTECWNDSFVSVYDNKSWDPAMTTGILTDCPDISTL